MATKQTRKSVSIRGTTYDRLRDFAATGNYSMSDIVEKALAAVFDGEQLQLLDMLQANDGAMSAPPKAPSLKDSFAAAKGAPEAPKLFPPARATLNGVPFDASDELAVERGKPVVRRRSESDERFNPHPRVPGATKPKPLRFCWWCSKQLWGNANLVVEVEGAPRTMHVACAPKISGDADALQLAQQEKATRPAPQPRAAARTADPRTRPAPERASIPARPDPWAVLK